MHLHITSHHTSHSSKHSLDISSFIASWHFAWETNEKSKMLRRELKEGKVFFAFGSKNGNFGFAHSKTSNIRRKVILQGSYKCLQRYYSLQQIFVGNNVLHLQKSALGSSLGLLVKLQDNLGAFFRTIGISFGLSIFIILTLELTMCQKDIMKHNVINTKKHDAPKQKNLHTLSISDRASSLATSWPPFVQIWVINLLPKLLASARMSSKSDAERPKVGLLTVFRWLHPALEKKWSFHGQPLVHRSHHGQL
jgi:hypothetical protein